MKNTMEHISFRKSWALDEKTINLLGQCYAYVNSMINIPLNPDYYKKLLKISLNKGALATTAIEGNTLTEEDLNLIQNGKNLKSSSQYQQKEIENVLDAFNFILDKLTREKNPDIISPKLIRQFHKIIGKDIGEAFEADPGYFRRQNVFVGRYRPPSFEKVDELVQKLCDWLIKEFHYNQEQNFDEAIIQAIVTHIYIAWIHPFSDGNGRTARLLEFYIILRAGIPDIASHILSNHYNNTRTFYYSQLQKTSETGDLGNFIQYALEGFRDGLEQVIESIHQEQTKLTWNNYVHNVIENMQGKSAKTLRRLRQLAFHIPAHHFCSLDRIRILTPKIAEEYRKLNIITLRRDLDLLVEKELLKVEKGMYSTNHKLLLPEKSAVIKRHY